MEWECPFGQPTTMAGFQFFFFLSSINTKTYSKLKGPKTDDTVAGDSLVLGSTQW